MPIVNYNNIMSLAIIIMVKYYMPADQFSTTWINTVTLYIYDYHTAGKSLKSGRVAQTALKMPFYIRCGF